MVQPETPVAVDAAATPAGGTNAAALTTSDVYPPLREALDEIDREEKRRRRGQRARRSSMIVLLTGLTLAGSVYAASVLTAWLSRQVPTDAPRVPRLQPLEVSLPATDSAHLLPDSARRPDTSTFRDSTLRPDDTAPSRS
jgi:hypothetical protein